MDSMTEVLARAVYGLNLNELPLDHLALGFQRPRTASVGDRHQHHSSQHEIAQPRLSSFSAIFEGPPSGSGVKRREQGERPKRRTVDITATRGPLHRSATQEVPASPPMSYDKRLSMPSNVGMSHGAPPLVMPAISEDSSSRHTSASEIIPSPTSPVSVSLVTPYQPLIEDDEPGCEQISQFIEGVEEEEKEGGAGEVIMNMNTTSPTPSQDKGSTSPPLSNGTSPEVGRRNISSSIFKHRSPESRHRKGQDLVLTNQPVLEEGGRSRWKKKWFPGHKRYGSDVTAQIRTTELRTIESEKEESPLVASAGKVEPPANTSQQPKEGVASSVEKPRQFPVRKSASEGDLRQLQGQAKTGLSPSLLRDDSALHDLMLRRISSSGSAKATPPTSTRDGGVVSPPTSAAVASSAHRPLRRSLTIDSPEPTTPAGTVRMTTLHSGLILIIILGQENSASSGHFFDTSLPTSTVSLPAGSGGWSCKVAAIVWLRMLKVLGNINDIRDPAVHAEAMAGLYQTWSALKSVSRAIR